MGTHFGTGLNKSLPESQQIPPWEWRRHYVKYSAPAPKARSEGSGAAISHAFGRLLRRQKPQKDK